MNVCGKSMDSGWPKFFGNREYLMRLIYRKECWALRMWNGKIESILRKSFKKHDCCWMRKKPTYAKKKESMCYWYSHQVSRNSFIISTDCLLILYLLKSRFSMYIFPLLSTFFFYSWFGLHANDECFCVYSLNEMNHTYTQIRYPELPKYNL